MDIIAKTAKITDSTEKVETDSILNLTKSTVFGSDVISVIRYYKDSTTVQIVVTVGGNTKTYSGENYDSSVFNIPYETEFDRTYTYDGTKLKKVTYIEK
jgi:hypothetical protein